MDYYCLNADSIFMGLKEILFQGLLKSLSVQKRSATTITQLCITKVNYFWKLGARKLKKFIFLTENSDVAIDSASKSNAFNLNLRNTYFEQEVESNLKTGWDH